MTQFHGIINCFSVTELQLNHQRFIEGHSARARDWFLGGAAGTDITAPPIEEIKHRAQVNRENKDDKVVYVKWKFRRAR